MSGLLSLLDLGSGAIVAQNAGVAVAGRNTANVNTEGYSRESVNLSALPGVPILGGVLAGNATRTSDEYMSTQERLAAGAQGRSSALSAATSQLERLTSASGQSLIQSYGSFFGALDALAAQPTDTALRQQVLTSAEGLAQAYHAIADSIARSQAEADASVAAIAKQASDLAQQLAKLNESVRNNSDPTLQDQRDLAARQLASLTGGQARIDPDGQLRFVLTGGQVLVDGVHAQKLEAVPDLNYGGHLRVDVVDGGNRRDVTTMLDGGQLAGQIAFRDGTAAQAAAALDQLAYDTATQVNTLHAAGAGLDGVTGRNLFLDPAGTVAGAASKMALDPAIKGNPRFVAAAQAGGTTGDSTNALALSKLGDQLLAGGGTSTFSDQAIRIFGDLGTASKSAAAGKTLDDSRVEVMKSARSSLSGVSTEEELARLAQFQHAAEAAGKFISVVNELLGNLISNL